MEDRPEQNGLAEQLIEEIARFKIREWLQSARNGLGCFDRDFLEASAVHSSLEAFEKVDDSDPAIAPSMIYAYAALKSGVRSRMELRT